MSAPIQLTGRNRSNVMTGAPDVRFSGGFWIGRSTYDSSKFPTSETEDPQDVAERMDMSSAGYITSDGVAESEDRTTEKILDWNLDVIDVVETDYGLQLTVTFAEAANAEVLKFIYGEDKVTVTPTGVYVKKGSRDLEDRCIMFDIKGKGGAKGRGFADVCQVASIGEITYAKAGIIQYQATIDVLTDVTGEHMHTWLGKRGATPPTGG